MLIAIVKHTDKATGFTDNYKVSILINDLEKQNVIDEMMLSDDSYV